MEPMVLTAKRQGDDNPPARARGGEQAAREEQTAETLFAAYLDPVYRYVSRRLARREETEDVTAEVFAAALTAWPRYQGQASPYVYLLGIARRKLADHQRRQRWRELLAVDLRRRSSSTRRDATEPQGAWDELSEAIPTPDATPEAALLRDERRQTIRALVSLLKAEQREALLLRYVEGLSVTEVAQVLGRSPAAANSLLQRAREVLRTRGGAYFLDDDTAAAATAATAETSRETVV